MKTKKQILKDMGYTELQATAGRSPKIVITTDNKLKSKEQKKTIAEMLGVPQKTVSNVILSQNDRSVDLAKEFTPMLYNI